MGKCGECGKEFDQPLPLHYDKEGEGGPTCWGCLVLVQLIEQEREGKNEAKR